MTRHPGEPYGASRNKQPGSKQFYRRVFSASSWDRWLEMNANGTVLHVCCGGSRFGLGVDFDRLVPGVRVVAEMTKLPFAAGSFDTVCCDPMYNLSNPIRVHLQRELVRVARRRLLFKAPWIPRATGWQLVETMLLASHTCANVAVLSRLDHSWQESLLGESEP
jgi:hypothetical protein